MNPKVVLLSVPLIILLSEFTGNASVADQDSPSQIIYRAGSRASMNGPDTWFTGDVRVDPLFSRNDTEKYSGASVTFEPGARTAWHIHPAGQHMLVVSGVGRTGGWGGPVEEIRTGDAVWCPPGVKHWHGASPTTAMTHIVVMPSSEGQAVEWFEKVTDEQYNGE